MTVLLAENLDTLKLILVKYLLQVKKTCLLWAIALNFSPTDIHPVAGTDPDPASILLQSDLYIIV